MQLDPEKKPGKSTGSKLPAIIVVVIIAIGGIWLYLQQSGEPEPETAPPVSEPAPESEPDPESRTRTPDEQEVSEAPDVPEKEPEPAAEEPEEEPEPQLPPVAESDPYVREVVKPLNDAPAYDKWLQTDSLIQKSATVLDGLARGKLPRKTLPMEPPEEDFQVERDGDRLLIAESNYERYDRLTETVTAIPPEQLAETFDTLRPLLESAYGQLGKPEDMADNALISAIDRILAAPEVEGPVVLKRESVNYQFADPELESLPEVHKQMIRMGPENAERIKNYLREVKKQLLEQEESAP